jgi:hypothetical protein
MTRQIIVVEPRVEEPMLPRLVMTERRPSTAPREVGGKTYCTIHGRAHHDNGGCPVCTTADKPPQVYKNIVLNSRKVGRAVGMGKTFVPEVISVHFVGSAEELAAEERRLKTLHGIR